MALLTNNKEYNKYKHRWDLCRATMGGSDVIKGITEDYNPKDFLPMSDDGDKERYKKYLLRAVYINYVGWTQEGLTGVVFRKQYQLETPVILDYIDGNINGSGKGIEQFSKMIVGNLLSVGRAGVLVDHPKTNGKQTKEEVANGNKVATANYYKAESIFNWSEKVINGAVVLTQVRLHEIKTIEEDEFNETEEKVVRVLSLDDAGNYFYRILNEKEEVIEGPLYPTKKDGTFFKEIPFQFFGAVDNRPTVDKPPLYDIAIVNLAHYRNSADHEENLFIHGQGTLFLTSNMSWKSFNEANPNGIMVGARKGHFLGDGGNAQLLQLDAATAIGNAMDSKVAQMIGIGARFIQDKSGKETAEAAKIGAGQQVSGLGTLVGNVSDGMLNVIGWLSDFMGGKGESTFELNKDFFDQSITALEASTFAMFGDTGVVAKADIRHLLRRVGWLRQDRTDEQIDQEIVDNGE